MGGPRHTDNKTYSFISIPYMTSERALPLCFLQGGNMVMEPVLDTFRPAPWAGRGKYRVAEVLSELRYVNVFAV